MRPQGESMNGDRHCRRGHWIAAKDVFSVDATGKRNRYAAAQTWSGGVDVAVYEAARGEGGAGSAAADESMG